jgi:hypothetical protein
MRTVTILSGLFASMLLAPAVGVGAQADCEPARCAVQAALNSACTCDTASNHGRYVSCVAHVVKQLSDAGTIPVTCRGAVKRCAARSVCGKPGFVTCQIPTDTCDQTTLHCVAQPTLACLVDADCGTRCKIKHSNDLCLRVGGAIGASSTCCATCSTVP